MSRRIGFAIAARCGSTRLPRKHMLEANGRPLLWYLLQRTVAAAEARPVIIATTVEPENELFRAFANERVSFFAGSTRNIPLRFLEASRSADLDGIVTVDGDDILCSVAAMTAVRERLEAGSDFVSTRGLPLGMNAAGFSRACLERAEPERHAVLETGWHRIFGSTPIETVDCGAAPDPRLRFTLDYEADLAFFQRVLSALGDDFVSVSDAALIDLVVRERFFEINADVNDSYWSNFKQQVDQEQSSI